MVSGLHPTLVVNRSNPVRDLCQQRTITTVPHLQQLLPGILQLRLLLLLLLLQCTTTTATTKTTILLSATTTTGAINANLSVGVPVPSSIEPSEESVHLLRRKEDPTSAKNGRAVTAVSHTAHSAHTANTPHNVHTAHTTHAVQNMPLQHI